MLARKYRLTSENDFKKIFSRGKSGYSRFFRLKFMENGLDHCRFAVVASIKVSKKAVERNQLKRRTRDIIYSLLPKSGLNYDVLVDILPLALDQEFSGLSDDLAEVFNKSRLI